MAAKSNDISAKQSRDDMRHRLMSWRRIHCCVRKLEFRRLFVYVTCNLTYFVLVAIGGITFGDFLSKFNIIVLFPIIVIILVLSNIIQFAWYLDYFSLNHKLKKYKEKAANILEEYDCIALNIPYPEHLGICDSDRPMVDKASTAVVERCSNGEYLPNWYTEDSIDGGKSPTVIECLISNLQWDDALQKGWRCHVVKCMSVFYIIVITWVILNHGKLDQQIIPTLLSLFLIGTNFLAVYWKKVEDHLDDAKRLDSIRDFLSNDRIDRERNNYYIRAIQDAILQHRRTSLTVPDWFSRRWRRKRDERCQCERCT